MHSKTLSTFHKAIYEQLNGDVLALSWKWQIVTELFESKEKVELLNQTASSFFLACQMTFTDDVLLALSRITDFPRSVGQDNLVITRLLEELEQTQHPTFHAELSKLIGAAMQACNPFKQHKHKKLAHNDLNIKLKQTNEPLPGIMVGDVNRAVKSLQAIMNAFSRYFFNSETQFEVEKSGGVEALMIYLRKAVDTFEQEKQAMSETLGLTNGSPQDTAGLAKNARQADPD
jgi:hypothetical protein